MRIFLVTYDLNTRGQNYEDLLNKIKSFPSKRLSESSYAEEADKTAQQLYDYLKTSLDSNDQIYIINITQPYAGFGPKDVNSWLDTKLPNTSLW